MLEAVDPVPPSTKFHKTWLPRLRFSLQTLILVVLLVGSAGGLWWRWEPWGFERTFQLEPVVPNSSPPIASTQFTTDGKRLLTFWAQWAFMPPLTKPWTVLKKSIVPPTACMFDIETGRQIWSFIDQSPWSGDNASCVLSSDGEWVCLGRTLANVDSRGNVDIDQVGHYGVKLLNSTTGTPIVLPERILNGAKSSLSQQPMNYGGVYENVIGQRVQVMSDLKVVDIDSTRVIQKLDKMSGPVVSISISNDDKRIAAVNMRGSVRVWCRRHPPYWWGVAWLPEFWFAVLFAGALVWNAKRR